jgi:hypothetical protein
MFFVDALRDLNEVLPTLNPLPELVAKYLFPAKWRKLINSIKVIKQVNQEIIQKRRQSGEVHDDFLDILFEGVWK